MFRTLDLVMIAALVATAGWTFKVKHDTRIAQEELTALQNRLRLEQEAIDILRADWSLLTSPERLQMLSERFKGELGLEEVAPSSIGSIGEVPTRDSLPLPGEGTGDHGVGEKQLKAEGDPDMAIKTGSVEKQDMPGDE
ncbi:MAG: hypothetical protein WBO55_15210 [Rhizobiaceae bacterium]